MMMESMMAGRYHVESAVTRMKTAPPDITALGVAGTAMGAAMESHAKSLEVECVTVQPVPAARLKHLHRPRPRRRAGAPARPDVSGSCRDSADSPQ